MSHLSRKERKKLRRILLAAALLIFTVVMTPRWESTVGMWGDQYIADDGTMVITQPWIPLWYLAAYLIIGWDILWKALRNIRNAQIFDENFATLVIKISCCLFHGKTPFFF